MVSEKEVLDILNLTGDPEVGIGIVDLGLIAHLDIVDDFVRVSIRTTTSKCPFQPFIMMEAHRKVLQLVGVKGAEVEVSQESPWHPDLMSDAAKERLGFYPNRLEMAASQVPVIRVPSSTDR